MSLQSASTLPRERLTAILTAMPEEASAVRAAMCDVSRWPGAPGVVRGRLGHANIALTVTGDGERRAEVRALQLLTGLGPDVGRVLVLGVAGALCPSLQVGDLVLADEVRSERGGETLYADRALTDIAARCTGARRGVVVSGTAIADTAADKRRLHALAQARPAVVDLESFAYARAAGARGVPWLILRAVSDAADEVLPSLLNRCRDSGGAVERSRVLRALLTDPRPLPKLLRLRQRVARSSGRLAKAAVVLLSNLGDVT